MATDLSSFTRSIYCDQGKTVEPAPMSKKQKLELTWIARENWPKLEPRILLVKPERSYHAKFRVAAQTYEQ